MRGKVVNSKVGLCGNGITPAYAGKSQKFFVDQRFPLGSPPPMRGKVHLPAASTKICRITPAYAGKSKKCNVH